MIRHAMVSDKPSGLSVQPSHPPGKLAAQLKSPFGDSCFFKSMASQLFSPCSLFQAFRMWERCEEK